jgi:hypothetical protein
MPESDFAAAQFIPWIRQGVAEMAEGGAVQVQFKVNAEDVTMPIRLLGPGSVTGIDPKQVIRMEPRPGTTDFTPYNFPAVEFDRPDFPWLFSPAKRDGNDRIRPWLCLVVVRKQAGVALQFEQSATLAKLEIKDPAKPGQELPNLEESWAWAHAQVVGRSGTSTLEEGLADAALNLSRLVCPRKLEPDTDYIACVVPAFETGRRAGLGLSLEGAGELTPSWQINGSELESVTVPVYHHWEFRAGPPVDFESLVRLLKARPLPEKAGKRDIWIGNAGLGLPQIPPDGEGAVLAMQGALKPPDSKPGEWPPVSREPFRMQLRTVVNSPAEALEQGAVDPVVAPPIYGRWHAGKSRVELSGGDPPWLHELNLDPRYRAAAGLGAEVVRRDQESLMAAAWEQVGEIQQANQLLRRAQVARAVTTSIHARHFGKMPEETLVEITAPAHAKLRAVPLPDRVSGTLTLRGQILRSTTTAPPVSMRKVTRPRGAISRKANRPPQTDIIAAAVPMSSNMVTIEKLTDAIFVSQPDIKFKVRSLGASPQTFDPAPPRDGFVWVFTLQAEGGLLLHGHWERKRVGEPPGHRPLFLNFQAAAGAHEERIPRPRSIEFQNPMTLGSLSAAILGQLNPATTIASRVHGRIRLANASFANAAAEDPLSPIMAAPEFPRPMYEALRDISSDFLLPGLEHVPPNTATLVQTNPEFVESFMTGLSTEMARELLWREFPTDQRGTYFRQFWAALNAADRRQIQAIHEWKNPLGKNAEPGQREASIVLLLRGELLRRYPHTVIYAKKAVMSGTRRVPGGTEKYPLFRGSLEPDVTFLGFDLSKNEALGDGADQGWFFVLQEQPTAPRFGLDKPDGFADTIDKAAKWSDLTWGHVAANQSGFNNLTHVPATGSLPDTSGISQPPGVIWGKNSAHLAYATFQQPVRIAIHASDMISTETEVRE